ncbi:MAG: hypothetical protein EOP84_15995 [Verrucomicrobiaceae bacterium]|nr:MAG: hypothetical protein EOP84_15995 [Verrucomicrobiaceae bacterium]
MNRSLRNSRNIVRVVFASLLVVAPLTVLPSRVNGETPAAPAKAPDLDQQIAGTWVYIGTPGAPVAPPATGARYKMIQHGLYRVTQKDAAGTIIYHHGGVYTLDGDQYAEECKYSSKEGSELLNQTYRFTLKVEGDKLIQTGVGNPYTEVWKRVK